MFASCNKVHSVWCEYWVLLFCHLHHAVRNSRFMWVTFGVLIVKNAGYMEFIGCTCVFFLVLSSSVFSVFKKNFAVIYMNFSVP